MKSLDSIIATFRERRDELMLELEDDDLDVGAEEDEYRKEVAFLRDTISYLLMLKGRLDGTRRPSLRSPLANPTTKSPSET